MKFFTSDLHLGHENVARYCNRPFTDMDHMNSTIINNINEVVKEEDELYILGDIALGKLDENLALIKQIHCSNLYLIPGNHDRCWKYWSYKTEEKRRDAKKKYENVGFTILSEIEEIDIVGHKVLLSHLPYTGDSTNEERYEAYRPKDQGQLLIHGHIHTKDKAVGNQFHVGVDAWNFFPVSQIEIESWVLSSLTKSSHTNPHTIVRQLEKLLEAHLRDAREA